jgi:hypothetical protein
MFTLIHENCRLLFLARNNCNVPPMKTLLILFLTLVPCGAAIASTECGAFLLAPPWSVTWRELKGQGQAFIEPKIASLVASMSDIEASIADQMVLKWLHQFKDEPVLATGSRMARDRFQQMFVQVFRYLDFVDQDLAYALPDLIGESQSQISTEIIELRRFQRSNPTSRQMFFEQMKARSLELMFDKRVTLEQALTYAIATFESNDKPKQAEALVKVTAAYGSLKQRARELMETALVHAANQDRLPFFVERWLHEGLMRGLVNYGVSRVPFPLIAGVKQSGDHLILNTSVYEKAFYDTIAEAVQQTQQLLRVRSLVASRP